MAFHEDHISRAMELHHYTDHQDNVAIFPSILPDHSPSEANGKPVPTWLNNAIIRQQNHPYTSNENNFLHLQTTNSDSSASNQWLSREIPPSSDSMILMSNQEKKYEGNEDNTISNESDEREWQNAKSKADILAHPLYDQLLSAHVSCLRIATPVDQLPRIDAQLEQSQQVVAKYSILQQNNNQPLDGKDLDQFMVTYISYNFYSHCMF